jgi:lipopolysaccharide export system ATP-binding protein
MALLETKSLKKSYGGRPVVNGVDITINRGEIVGLLGQNGAGKTTTFYMVTGIVKPDDGSILFDHRDISRYPMHMRARLGIGYLSQEPSIFRKLTVEENILAVLETLDLPRHERQSRLEELLNELGIAHLRKSKALTLSGGERRRLEITRALVTHPRVLLLDEHSAALDPRTAEVVMQLKDGNGRYLWGDEQGLNSGVPTNLINRPIVFNEWASDIAAGAFPLILADLSRAYTIANRVEFSVKRFDDSTYATQDNTLLLGRARLGGMVTQPLAIKALKIATS